MRYWRCIALLIVLVPLMFWHHKIATIPVPGNAELMPGELMWDNSQWVMDLNSREIKRRTDPQVLLMRGAKRVGINHLEESRQLDVTVETLERQLLYRRTVDMWGTPEVLSGRYLVHESRAVIQACDLEAENSRVLTTKVAPIQNSGGSAGSGALTLLDGTNRFVRDNFPSGTNDFSLYAIEPDQIRCLATWNGNGAVRYCGDRLYIEVPGQTYQERTVEVRSAIDGSYLETISFPDPGKRLVGQPYSVVNTDLWLMYDQTTHFAAYDLKKKTFLNLPAEHLPIVKEGCPYLFLRSPYVSKLQRFVLFDRDTEQVVREIVSPLEGEHFGIFNKDHIWFFNHKHGLTAALVDINTGRQVGRWSPYERTSWSALLFCSLMLSWVVLWYRASAQAGLWAWLDVWLVSGLLAVMAMYRIDLSYFGRLLSLMTTTQLLLAPLQCALWMCLMTKGNWLRSLSLILLNVGLVQWTYSSLVSKWDETQRCTLLLVAGITLTYVALVAVILQRLRWSISRGQDQRRPIALLDIMLITFSAAVTIAALKRTMPLSFAAVDSELAMWLCLPILLGVTGLVLGFAVNESRYRRVCAFTLAAITLFVGYEVVQLYLGISPIKLLEKAFFPRLGNNNSLRSPAVVMIHHLVQGLVVGLFAPFLTTIPLRLRGWRLIVERQSPAV